MTFETGEYLISVVMTLGGLIVSIVIGCLFCDHDCFDEAFEADVNSPANLVG